MPNRIIKESIRTSKKINALTDAQFRLWAYLITYVDDYGRGSADPEIIKGYVYPRRKNVTEKQIWRELQAMATIGVIQLYEVRGESLLCLPGWERHQVVRNKKSKFPAPEDNPQAFESNCNQLQADVSVIQSNPIQSESESECEKTRTPARKKRGEHGYVKLTDEEYARLIDELGEAETARCIAYVDESAARTENKNGWKNWNLVIRKCHRENWGAKTFSKPVSKPKEVKDYGAPSRDALANMERLLKSM